MSRLTDYCRWRSHELVKVVSFVTDSNSQPQLFHDVELWQDSRGEWWGSCDEDLDLAEPTNKFYCKANRLGGRLCSHLARCIMQLGLVEEGGDGDE